MSQALPVDQPRWVDGKKVDCNGAPWIEAGIGMDVLPRSLTQVDWRDEMAKAKEIVEKQTKPVKKPTLDDVIAWGANSKYAVLYTVAQQCFPDFMRLDDAAEYLHELHEEAIEKAKAKDGVAAVFANLQGKMSSIKKAKAVNEDEAVKGDDQSNETLNEEGELVEAPKNNEKPETNLKRKNAMVNGSTPKKSKQEKDVITTANAVKHVQKMKVNIPEIVANIGTDNVARSVEEMDKLIKKVIESDTPGMESVVNGLSLIWVHLRQTLRQTLREKLQ